MSHILSLKFLWKLDLCSGLVEFRYSRGFNMLNGIGLAFTIQIKLRQLYYDVIYHTISILIRNKCFLYKSTFETLLIGKS